MIHYKDRFRKNLFEPNSTQSKTLLGLIDDEIEKEIIKGYCERKLCPPAQEEINRLQEEKEALINGQETLQKHIAEQKAENERLEKENTANLEWAEKEIKRLKGVKSTDNYGYVHHKARKVLKELLGEDK